MVHYMEHHIKTSRRMLGRVTSCSGLGGGNRYFVKFVTGCCLRERSA
jgi:hypothetical protein